MRQQKGSHGARRAPVENRTSLYLEDIPRGEAEARLRNALIDAHLWGVLGSETIKLDEHAAQYSLRERAAVDTGPGALNGFWYNCMTVVEALISREVNDDLLEPKSVS